MAELVPLPLSLLLRRALVEHRREGKIFDLPQAKFFRGLPGLDLSVDFHGHRVATPLGPAAGPHGQLAQNVALAWLAGARVIELKTVQILDELKIPRPCIDAANVGYNVEWSQELKLEQSLREYVKASMLVEALEAAKPAGELPRGHVFDMSVGYNLDGIRSPRVRAWIEGMLDARAMVDELRCELSGEWRDLPFRTRISDTIALSTFHGCPANEIEGIVTFLIAEMGCHVCVKLNPTLLGIDLVSHLLHDVMGYREIVLHPPAFDNDLQFDEALDLIPRLQSVARTHGRSFSLKFTNTLVVKNHKRVFSDDVMYMSGAPLHVLAMNLVAKFRERIAEPIPISFSGGIDANNMAPAVAMNFVPVTTCTDLLRQGGYARLPRYLEKLGEEMRKVDAATIPEFVARYRGVGGTPHEAGLRNTPILVKEATENPRYHWEKNKGEPRKIGSKLWLYDCINCDKCVPVCPNDANFVYDAAAIEIAYSNYLLLPDGIHRVAGGELKLRKQHQLANYADACNECGNCDVFCPEDGGPFLEKPRFFGSVETFERDARNNGFFADCLAGVIQGVIGGKRYALTLDRRHGTARFEQAGADVEIRLADNEPLQWWATGKAATGTLDMLPYLQLKLLLDSISDPRRVHFVNAAALEEANIDA